MNDEFLNNGYIENNLCGKGREGSVIREMDGERERVGEPEPEKEKRRLTDSKKPNADLGRMKEKGKGKEWESGRGEIRRKVVIAVELSLIPASYRAIPDLNDRSSRG